MKPKHVCKQLFWWHITFVKFLFIPVCHPSATVHSSSGGGPATVDWWRIRHHSVRLEYPRYPSNTWSSLNPSFWSVCSRTHQTTGAMYCKSTKCLYLSGNSQRISASETWPAACQPKNNEFVSAQFLLNAGNNRNRHYQAGRGSACTVSVEWWQHENSLVFSLCALWLKAEACCLPLPSYGKMCFPFLTWMGSVAILSKKSKCHFRNLIAGTDSS